MPFSCRALYHRNPACLFALVLLSLGMFTDHAEMEASTESRDQMLTAICRH